MSDIEEVRQTLLESIQRRAAGSKSSTALLQLAEAFAWTVSPNQPHGSREAELKAD